MGNKEQETNPKLPLEDGANSNSDPTYNVRMLMEANNASIKELTEAKVKHVEEMQALHVMYQEKLTVAEAKRIDAILDANAKSVETDRERAAAQATVLATQVSTSAETLRQLVATTAAAQAAALAQTTSQLTERLSALERARYEDVGKDKIADPMQVKLMEKIEQVLSTQSVSKGAASISTPALMLIAGAVVGFIVWIIENGLVK